MKEREDIVKTSGIFFAIIIILFLLPFTVVNFNGEKLDSLNGYQMALGSKVKAPSVEQIGKVMGIDLTQFGAMVDPNLLNPEPIPVKAKPMVLIPLVLAILGLLTALFMSAKSYIVPLALAVLGFILMLFKGGASFQLSNLNANQLEYFQSGNTLWYWLTLLGFLLAAIFAYLAGRKSPITKEQISNIIPDKVENAFGKAKDSVTAAGAAALNKADDLYDKAKEKVEDTYDKAKDTIERANLDDKLDNVLDKAKEKIDTTYDKVKDKVEDTVDKVKDLVDDDTTK